MAAGLPTLVSLAWLVPWACLLLLHRRRPRLVDAPSGTGTLVSVIVPARNEGENIVPLLASLRGSSYEPFEIVVVDDRSSDDTAIRAAAAAAGDERVRVVPGRELPDGWFGKPWACYQGYQAARGDLLLFTDADTRHGPDVLAHAVGALQAGDSALVTLLPRQECVTFWERVVMPQIWTQLGLRFHPLRVNAARRLRDVIANGQYILTSRGAYERAGTHRAVRTEVAEDLALAQAYHRCGLRVTVWWAEEMIATRMYTGFRHLVEGWSKNLHLGARASFPDEPVLRAVAPAMPVVWELFWLAPVVLALVTAGAPWALWAWVFATGFWMLVSAGMRIPSAYGFLYPLGAGAALYIMLRSTWRGRRRVEWRGRTYRGGG